MDFINILMIWFYAFAVYFAIRSEIFVMGITINLHVGFYLYVNQMFNKNEWFLLDFLTENVLFIKASFRDCLLVNDGKGKGYA